MNRERLTLFLCSILETDIKKYEMKTQTSGDDAVNDLRYEIKFENCLKEKINFCIKQNIAFPSRRHIFFKISNNLITSAFFFAEADTKKH